MSEQERRPSRKSQSPSESREESASAVEMQSSVFGSPKSEVDFEGLRSVWAANRRNAEEQRRRAIRAARDDDAPRRLLHAASHWRTRDGVTFSMDFAIRLIGVVAMLKKRGCPPITLPEGTVSAVAQKMLNASWKDGLRSRSCIASMFAEFCAVAERAGEINISVERDDAWLPNPNPPRDSVHYFRTEWTSPEPTLFGDIARAAGIPGAAVNEKSVLDLLAERLSRRTQYEMIPLEPSEIEELSREFNHVASMPYGEESIRRLRHTSERAGRGTLGFESNWMKARKSEDEVVLAQHSDGVVFVIGRQRPPLRGTDLMTSMRVLVEHAEQSRLKFVTSADDDGFLYRHHFLEFVAQHQFVPIPGSWTVEYASRSTALLDSDTNAANASLHRDFCYRFAKAASRVVRMLSPLNLGVSTSAPPEVSGLEGIDVEDEQEGDQVIDRAVGAEGVGSGKSTSTTPPWTSYRSGGAPLHGWYSIAKGLGETKSDSFIRRMKRLNKQTNGPIRWCGRSPEVDPGELVAWIENIDARSSARSEAAKGRTKSIKAISDRGDLSLQDERLHLEKRPGSRGRAQDRQRSTTIDNDRPSQA